MRTGASSFRLILGVLLTTLVGLTALSANVAAQRSDAVARDARVGGDLKRTRFVADLSATVDFRAFLLADPYRVIIDLPKVQFQMPPGIGETGRGLINAFRYGLFAQGKSRIVIDTVGPVAIEKAFVRPSENGQPARLVIDLVSASEQEFQEQWRRQAALRAIQPQTNLTGPGGEGASGRDGDSGKPTIVLDPGHGGPDPGTVTRNGVYEKNVVFSFCQVLKAELEANGRFRVLMTRSEDIFVPLQERVEFARQSEADLMISVHADALDIKHPLVTRKMLNDVRGASVYTLSEEASDARAKLAAARENNSDVLAGIELPASADGSLESILIDLMHRETKNLSIAFAKKLLKELGSKTPLLKSPHRFADFRVLKAEDVPSVLVELGYLSNEKDETALTSKEWRLNVAKAMAKSIRSFFEQRHVSVPG
ncbi:MAG: N-acetylmuramoyl-L-alanine amidase [Hyphomicrobiales bacterium]|nr:N-acetylmuramoyl-L-alanine amidase [Hyphomicrobiales bacterium]